MKRILCIILCLLLLCGQAIAVNNTDNLEWQIKEFMEAHGLTEENFSYSYYDTGTRTILSFNEEALFPVGDVWRLPLNMYYYREETNGAYEPPIEDPDWEYTIQEKTLEECRRASILENDNEVSLQMRDNLGDLVSYKLLINEKFGQLSTSQMTEEFLNSEKYNAVFLLNCLISISRHPEQYGDMMQNFSFVQKDNGLSSKTYTKPYQVVHVYGKQDGFICDIGEISAPEKYLLVVLISEEVGDDALIGEFNNLICTFVEQNTGAYKDNGLKKLNRTDKDYQLSSAAKMDFSRIWKWIGYSVAAVVAVALVSYILYRLLRRSREFDDM